MSDFFFCVWHFGRSGGVAVMGGVRRSHGLAVRGHRAADGGGAFAW